MKYSDVVSTVLRVLKAALMTFLFFSLNFTFPPGAYGSLSLHLCVICAGMYLILLYPHDTYFQFSPIHSCGKLSCCVNFVRLALTGLWSFIESLPAFAHLQSYHYSLHVNLCVCFCHSCDATILIFIRCSHTFRVIYGTIN